VDDVTDQPVVGDLGGSAERAAFYREAAAEAKGKDATTFSDEAVYEALSACVEVFTRKLLEASHIRSERTKPGTGRLRRRR